MSRGPKLRASSKPIFEEFWLPRPTWIATISQAREQGYVTTLLGRKKYLRDINARNAMMRGFDERNAINAPIQGTEAEMIKLDMGRISTDGLERPSWTPR